MLTELNQGLDDGEIASAIQLIHEAENIYYFGTCDNIRRFQQNLLYTGKRVEVYQIFSGEIPSLVDWPENSVAIVENPGYPWFRSDNLISRISQARMNDFWPESCLTPEMEN